MAATIISIHAPARGATLMRSASSSFDRFQSKRPQGARHSILDVSFGITSFQSTRPQGARLAVPSPSSSVGVFQSTRPRGARPARIGVALAEIPFQSTRPRGARRHGASRPPDSTRFNPRAREGRDCDHAFCGRVASVSIHAPARGATGHGLVEALVAEFQSTRPRGARLAILATVFSISRFNPRAREGRDHRPFLLRPVIAVSIHAPARGATFPVGVGLHARVVSIHAPARGATAGLWIIK